MAGQSLPVPLTAIWCETLILLNQTLKNHQKLTIQILKNQDMGKCGECHIDLCDEHDICDTMVHLRSLGI